MRGEHANHYTTNAVQNSKNKYIGQLIKQYVQDMDIVILKWNNCIFF